MKISTFFIRVFSRNSWAKIFLVAFCGVFIACSPSIENSASNTTTTRQDQKEIQTLRAAMSKVEPFFKPMGKPEAYDWLGSYNERGQTFDEYLESIPTLPTIERKTIYVLPIGKFTPQQRKIIDITAGYLEAFYDLQVRTMRSQPIKRPLNAKDQRLLKYSKAPQIRTGYLMDEVLKPQLPNDAAALIAFTSDDLYPDETMFFVFGQASLEDRVGVWSLARLDDNAGYDKFLLRTLKIAAHETGHMFSMRHCTKYECVMSGTNQLAETDRRPIDACPECMAKVCWLSEITPVARYKRLAEFCRSNGLFKEAGDFTRKAAAVSNS